MANQNKPQIETNFVLQGLDAALKSLRAFAQAAQANLDTLKVATEGIQKNFVGIAESAKGAGTAINESLRGVTQSASTAKASLDQVKKASQGAFGALGVAAKSAGLAAGKALLGIKSEAASTNVQTKNVTLP